MADTKAPEGSQGKVVRVGLGDFGRFGPGAVMMDAIAQRAVPARTGGIAYYPLGIERTPRGDWVMTFDVVAAPNYPDLPVPDGIGWLWTAGD